MPVRQTTSVLSIFVPWAVLLASVMFAAIVRTRLLQIPLERDEGEYAYAGQLLLQGIPPYGELFNMKFPGTYAAYALIMAIFGQSIAGIHIGFLLCNTAAIVLVFFLGRRLYGVSAGAASSAAYGLLSIGAGVNGTQGHATHLIVLVVLAGSSLLLYAVFTSRTTYLLSSGFFFGLGILMKQHAVFFAIFGAVYLAWEQGITRRKLETPALLSLMIYLAGLSVPLAFTSIALWRAGVFGQFWFWTFTYGRQYVLETTLADGISELSVSFSHVVGPNLLLWIFAAAGLLLTWWRNQFRMAARFTTSLLLFSFLGVCPGLYFREHYFVIMLPAVALFIGAALRSLQGLFGNVPSYLYLGVLLFSLSQQSEFLFRLSPHQAARMMYSINPFPEAIPVADYLRSHTSEGERIAVLGSEPEIYFYAHRRSVTGYIYTYAMMEPQPYALSMQNAMIHDIETARPAYVVLATVSTSWIIRATSSRHIFEWWNAFWPQRYKKVGVVEVTHSGQTKYNWDNVESYEPKSGVILEVYQRRD